jgi:hypothetical protein
MPSGWNNVSLSRTPCDRCASTARPWADPAAAVPWEDVHAWFAYALLPHFTGRTWALSRKLDAFQEEEEEDGRITTTEVMSTTDGPHPCYSSSQIGGMMLQLTRAGLLLPKWHVRPGRDDGCGGYWFSLPGLGRAAGSIKHGRSNALRRLQSCANGKRGWTALERDIEKSIVERRAWHDDSAGAGRDDGRDDGNATRMTRRGGGGLLLIRSPKFLGDHLL